MKTDFLQYPSMDPTPAELAVCRADTGVGAVGTDVATTCEARHCLIRGHGHPIIRHPCHFLAKPFIRQYVPSKVWLRMSAVLKLVFTFADFICNILHRKGFVRVRLLIPGFIRRQITNLQRLPSSPVVFIFVTKIRPGIVRGWNLADSVVC